MLQRKVEKIDISFINKKNQILNKESGFYISVIKIILTY